MKSISIDLETRSSVDIGKSGVYRYAEAEDFAILLFAYAVDGGTVEVIDIANGEQIPQEILDALTDESIIKCAFNANFERVCLSRYLSNLGIDLDPFRDNHSLSKEYARFLSPRSWRCTMVWSAYMGLPLSLAAVGRVLGLEEQKMTEGKALIRYFSTPPFHEPTGEKWELFMSPPTKELMKLTLEKKIAHGGHPVMRWMADNIFIRTDPAGNIKADKEKSTEKIDGVIALIMALDRAIRCGNDTSESVYENRGVWVF